MKIQKRAFYNSLRLDWLQNPSLPVEDWQVENYREMPYSVLFERLRHFVLAIDRVSFLSLAEEHETPEELTEELCQSLYLSEEATDRVYLLVFELWRRLMSHQPSLSVFCDELDDQISRYDDGQLEETDELEELIEQLQTILDSYLDESGQTAEVFDYIESYLAHDLEDFLVDFIDEEIEAGDSSYAKELLEGFASYVPDSLWFQLLQLKAMHRSEVGEEIREQLQHLFQRAQKQGEEELDWYLELLQLLVGEEGSSRLFHRVVLAILPLVKEREDLSLFLEVALDYYSHADEEKRVEQVKGLQRRCNKGEEPWQKLIEEVRLFSAR